MLSRGRGLWGRLLVVALGATLLPVLSASPAQADVPSAPQNVRAEQISLDEVEVTWTAPADDGGSPVAGYQAFCQWSSEQGDRATIVVGAVERSALVTLPDDLDARRLYCGAVATTGEGSSDPSVERILIARALDAPTISLLESSTAYDRLLVAFHVPVGGAGVPSIECSGRDGSRFTWARRAGVTNPGDSPFELELIVTGLPAGHHYRCRGRLAHDLPSAWSGYAEEFEHVGRPVAPSVEGIAVVSPNVVEVELSVDSDGGRPVAEYGVRCAPDPDPGYQPRYVTARSTDGRVTVRGLEAPSDYRCTAWASNAVGTSFASAPESVTTPAGRPAPPGDVRAYWSRNRAPGSLPTSVASMGTTSSGPGPSA